MTGHRLPSPARVVRGDRQQATLIVGDPISMSHCSNSGARRKPRIWRRNRGSWKEVLW